MMWIVANWKKFLAALCICAALGGSFWLGWRAAPKPTATASIDKSSTKVEKKTTIKTQPDGSSTTVIEESSLISQEKTKAAPDKSKYRAGLGVDTKAGDLKDGKFKPEYSITAGFRLVENLWLDARYGFTDKSVGLGLAWEW